MLGSESQRQWFSPQHYGSASWTLKKQGRNCVDALMLEKFLKNTMDKQFFQVEYQTDQLRILIQGSHEHTLDTLYEDHFFEETHNVQH